MSILYLSSRSITLAVEMSESPTAARILAAAPFDGTVSTWGAEIYFPTPVTAELEKGASADVEAGDVAYWPPGQALCVFFGPTPASTGDQPRAASPVTLVGRVVGDTTQLRELRDGDSIRVALEPQDTA